MTRSQWWIAWEDTNGPHCRPLPRGESVVGRAEECDVVVADFGLSRRHAKFVVDSSGVSVADLQSKGGTKVSGQAILESPLVAGDRVVLGQVSFELLEDFQEAPPPEAVIRRVAFLKGRPPEAFDDRTRLSALGDSFAAIMYVVTDLEKEYGVALPHAELMRLDTVGELVELLRQAPPRSR